MKKKILLVCKEMQSLSFFHSVEMLSKDYIIDIFFFMPHEDEKSFYYNLFKKNPFINKIYSTNYLIKKYFDLKKKNYSPNLENLRKKEKEFFDFKNIRMQLNASQFFSTFFHDRDIYKNFKSKEQLIFYEIYYESVMKILKESNPEYMFDNDISEFRTIIYEISRKLNIPYINIASSYYGEYYIPNFNLLCKPDNWLIEKVKNKTDFNIKEDEIKNKFNYEYINNLEKYFSLRFYTFLREIKNFFTGLISITNYYKKNYHKPPFGALPFPRTFLNLKFLIKKMIIKFIIKFSDDIDIDKEKYVLFPLHVAPEGSTFTISPLFLNENFIIELLSNCLPVDYKLVLKEHPSMIGQRSLRFYKKYQKLPNVEIIHPYSKLHIENLINKSSAVVTISGTSGMEALIMSKPVIVFAKPLYSFLEGCYVFNNIEDFKKDLEKIIKKKLFNKTEIHNYISIIKNYGKEINLSIINSIGKFPDSLLKKHINKFIEIMRIGINLNDNKEN